MRPVLLLLSFVLVATQATSCAYAQWDIEESHTTASLRGVHNVGGGVAWASGTDGTVLRTEDGGYLWQTCSIPPGAEKLDFRGVQAFDENTAIVMSSGPGDQSRLYKTTDGCQTWKLVFTNPDKEGFWDAIQLDTKGKRFGSLVGDPVDGHFAVFVTFDQGEHWERRRILPRSQEKESLFAASNSSLSLFNSTEVLVTGGPNGARLISLAICVGPESTCFELGDAGPIKENDPNRGKGEQVYWRAEALPLAKGDSGGAFSFARIVRSNQYRTVVVGGDYTKPTSTQANAVYWGSSMYGKLSQTPPHGYRSSVAYDKDQKLWITVGPNGTDISTDDGKNWHPLIPSPTDPADADKNWNALSLPFVVGPHGRIGRLRTIDQKAVVTKKP
jgi:photosystem II stability/assembly factor-like uncharacterized protein